MLKGYNANFGSALNFKHCKFEVVNVYNFLVLCLFYDRKCKMKVIANESDQPKLTQ
jgi:hypothetical protein